VSQAFNAKSARLRTVEQMKSTILKQKPGRL
jgi:hypothetical protein